VAQATWSEQFAAREDPPDDEVRIEPASFDGGSLFRAEATIAIAERLFSLRFRPP
jgi:hypothetical protein